MPKTKPSGPQLNYLQARALFETVEAEYRERLKINAWSERDSTLRQELGYDESFGLLCEAEEQLIDWARSMIEREPCYRSHRAELEKVWNVRLPHLRTKLIDLCARLAV